MSLHVFVCQDGHLAMTDTQRTWMNDCPTCYVDGLRGVRMHRVPGVFMLIHKSDEGIPT